MFRNVETRRADVARHVIILNDREAYNRRYRFQLMERLTALGYEIESLGTLDRMARFPLLALRLIGGRSGRLISSNLKSNLFALMLCRRPKMVILNGMGRLRGNGRFRALLLTFLRLRRNTVAVVQNYADFRYLRRYCPLANLVWVPGSGGTAKSLGNAETAVMVQRDNKIGLVSCSVVSLLAAITPRRTLAVVGCKDKAKLKTLFPDVELIMPGVVPSEDIFRNGGIFVQPTGYGEGFPHTLADAIVSGMDILISDIEFLRYGLGELGGRRSPLAPGWSRLIYDGELRNAVQVDTITDRIIEVFEGIPGAP